MHAADHEIQQLILKHAIVPCAHDPEDHNSFMNNVFLVPKKDSNEFRMILNLKKFNCYIEKYKFKMETLNSMLDMVTQGLWLTSVYLSNAYLVIPILKQHSGFLKFIWRDVVYKYIVMAFGLTSAPRKFTKLLKVLLSWLSQTGTSGIYVFGRFSSSWCHI